MALAVTAILVAAGCATTLQAASGEPALKSSVRGWFAMGVGISDRIPERPGDWLLLTNQFDTITPENCMKPDPVQVAEGRFEFAGPDGRARCYARAETASEIS